MTSSSRIARASADDSTVFITCTFRIEWPAASWPVRKRLHPGGRQPGQRIAAQRRLEVQPDSDLIQRVRGGPAVRGHDVLQPVVEPVAQLPGPVRDGDALAVAFLGFAHLVGGFLAGLAVDGDALAGACAGPGVVAAHPAAVGAFGEGAVAVDAAAGGAGHQATSSAWSSSWRT